MSEERREGVNLLQPEVSQRESEAHFAVPEQAPEQIVPREQPRVDQRQIANIKTQITAAVQQVPAPKDQMQVDVERILSDRLGEIYNQLPEDKRAEFKAKGEEVSAKIRTMIVTAKVKAHQVLKLIAAWLGIIPHVNVYFLQQEAKIKLDHILDYAEDYRQNAANRV